MNKTKYIQQSLQYFQKQHLAVLLATLISAAVLTGALIVGDSVRISLQKNVDQRLGKTSFALATGDRFVRAELVKDILLSNPTDPVTHAPVEENQRSASILYLQGISINPKEDLRHNRTQVLGVDKDFWGFSDGEGYNIKANEVVISEELARELNLLLGETLLLRIQNADIIPLNAPFTSDEDPSKALRLKITGIAKADQLGQFSLKNQQATAYNVFVNRVYLAQQMELEGLCNLILVTEDENLNEDFLQRSLKKHWKLKDASLQLRDLEATPQMELLSDRVFIDHSISEQLRALTLKKEEILTYFVNSLSTENHSCPYSFVTAASPGLLNQELKSDEIIINEWLAEDLKVQIGDELVLKYFVIGPLRALEEHETPFIIKDILAQGAPPFLPDLMPDFPGLSTAGNCSDWDAGIPIDLNQIRDQDEKYWDDYQGTPKAIISLDKGLELWENLFGNYTAIRFEAQNISKKDLEESILKALSPEDVGLRFQNVRSQGERAAVNGVDFGELFLSLSFFVMAAAILLMVLMYRLNLESRMSEVGILFALGYSRKQILRLRLLESLPTIVLGSILGALAGIFYNQWMISGLNGVWNQAVHADMLEVFILPNTILIGMVISFIISLLSIYLVLRKMLKKTVISVIREQKENLKLNKNQFDFWMASISLVFAIAILTYALILSLTNNSGLMLMTGFLLLTGLTFLVSFILRKMGGEAKNTGLNLWKLALINARRNQNRSIAVIGLLAIGTFTIIVTGANRKTFSGEENQRSSGTGGFKFWAETSIPILQDLNSEEARNSLALIEEPVFEQTRFVQFHSRNGDDASCLNLNQVQQPQIFGVDEQIFDSLGAFSFATMLHDTEHPWLELSKATHSNIIPAIADQTVIQWGLMKKVGDTLNYFNEAGKTLHLVLVAGLNASIFQGNVLISQDAFIRHFPSAAGSKYMLIDAPVDRMQELKQVLSNDLTDYGIELTETSTRLAAFYSVTNTYLSIFMILGGFGVILGTLGLGIILMRNMLERKQELMLLKAIGYRKSQIFNLVLIENIFLLTIGMLIGIIAALIGILPSLLSSAFHIPSNFLLVLVLAVFLSGLLWIYLSAWRVMGFKT